MDKIVRPTLEFGSGSIMVWGCMTWLGVGALIKIVGNMDATQYVDILSNGLLPTITHVSAEPDLPPRHCITFQQDNDPKHTSRLAMKWFNDEDVKVMQWPTQSPDLNPIEHLWAHLKARLRSYEDAPRGVLELWQRVKEEWVKIPAQKCQTLIESMPRRINAVIKSRGGGATRDTKLP